jgi:hypothetical protein
MVFFYKVHLSCWNWSMSTLELAQCSGQGYLQKTIAIAIHGLNNYISYGNSKSRNYYGLTMPNCYLKGHCRSGALRPSSLFWSARSRRIDSGALPIIRSSTSARDNQRLDNSSRIQRLFYQPITELIIRLPINRKRLFYQGSAPR